MAQSFPSKTEKDLRKIEKGFYKNLCDYGVETLKLLTISKEELSTRMVFHRPELIHELAKENKSVLIYASHQFNWEWLLAAGSFSLPMPVDFVYQQQSSGLFNDFSLLCRTRFGAYPILRQHVGRESLKRKHITRAIAIVADQFPGHEKKYWTNFLHQETAFFQGIGQLAVVTQYPSFYFVVRKIKRGYYETKCVLIAAPPYKDGLEIIEAYAKTTEKVIDENPSGWLWSHKRWKRQREESYNA